MKLRLVYFAQVRESVGVDAEQFDLPPHIMTVGNILDWLAAESNAHKLAFADRERLRFALDQHMVDAGAAISAAEELAIFPPVTGG